MIQREKLADNARQLGEMLNSGLQQLAQKYPSIIKSVRGLGLMLGFELAPNIPALTVERKSQAVVLVNKLHDAGLLTIPAGTQVLRLLPALNLRRSEAEEGLALIESAVKKLV